MIIAENVKKSYKNGAVEVLKGISLKISDGAFAVITGASGSGKSTLMSVLSGLEQCDGGKILFQAQLPVDPADSAADIERKVHQLEYIHYPQQIERMLQ